MRQIGIAQIGHSNLTRIVETRLDFARANYVTSILAPRIFRFGGKVNF